MVVNLFHSIPSPWHPSSSSSLSSEFFLSLLDRWQDQLHKNQQAGSATASNAAAAPAVFLIYDRRVVACAGTWTWTKQAHFRSTFYIRKGNDNKQDTALLLEKFSKLVALLKLRWEMTTKKRVRRRLGELSRCRIPNSCWSFSFFFLFWGREESSDLRLAFFLVVCSCCFPKWIGRKRRRGRLS